MAAGLRPAIAADDASQAAIKSALAAWTTAFNAREAGKICDLFELGLIADICTEPEQTYTLICDRLKRSLGDDTRSYQYSSDIKEILVFGDMAVVRLVWTLTTKVARRQTPNPSRLAWTSSAGSTTEAGRSCATWRTASEPRLYARSTPMRREARAKPPSSVALHSVSAPPSSAKMKSVALVVSRASFRSR